MSVATKLYLAIAGQDKTASAFSSVVKRANAATSALRNTIAAVTGGVGAVMIVKNAKTQIDAMSAISDRAQQMGVSAEYVQKLSSALDQVGVRGADIDSLSQAFAKMTQETGAQGAKGFEDSLAAIAKIGDEQGRIEALSKTFGKALGANLAPLVRQGPDAFREGLRGVMAAMPAVSSETADMASGVSGALKMAGVSAKIVWQETLGDIMGWIQETFNMTPAAALTVFSGNVKFAVEVAIASFKTLGGNIKKIIVFFRDDWQEALKWVLNGLNGFGKAFLDYWLQLFKSVGNVAVQFGRQLWSAIKGNGFNWPELFEEAAKEMAKVDVKINNLWESMKIKGNDLIQFDELPDFYPAFEKSRENIKKSLTALSARAKLATGGAAEDAVGNTAKSAVKAIKEATKNSFVESGSYEAMKIMLANARGGAAGGASPLPGGTQASRQAVSGGGDRGSGLLQSIADAARSIERRLAAMERQFSKLEAV